MADTTETTYRFASTRKSRVSDDAPSFQGFAWILGKLLKGEDISDRMELRHEGRCGACGRKLTTPESIDTGIGPVCAARLGIAHGKGEAGAFDAKRFLLAGNATITATSIRTGKRFTYKVSRAKAKDAENPNPNRPYFVSLMTGTDNETSFTYMGCIFVGDKPAPRPRREDDIECAAIKAESAQAEEETTLLGHAADGGPTSRYCACRKGDTEPCRADLNYRRWKSKRSRERQASYRRAVFA